MKTWKSFYLLALAATLAFTGCKKLSLIHI